MRFFPRFATSIRFITRHKSAIIYPSLILSSGLLTCYAINGRRNSIQTIFNPIPVKVVCAEKLEPQSSVISETKAHALYLTIHLNPDASVDDCMKAISNMKKHIVRICPPDLTDESDEILYGVGFGSELYGKIGKTNKSNSTAFEYRSRNGKFGTLPNTGGDIFIHAKCHERGKLFELTQAIINDMPKGSVSKFEDVYGWVYRNGRDLSGFIDGTENPADPDERAQVAINQNHGGSFVLTQKWIHNHELIRSKPVSALEASIGRTLEDSVSLKPRPTESHVARMVGYAPDKLQIVRQSQPYGTYAGDSGLFFIAYSSDPKTLNFMLDRMTGESGTDGLSDEVMILTKCVSGNYWYFPSRTELDTLLQSRRSRFGW